MARVAFHALKITEEFEMWGATVGKEDLRTGGFGTMGRRVAGGDSGRLWGDAGRLCEEEVEINLDFLFLLDQLVGQHH